MFKTILAAVLLCAVSVFAGLGGPSATIYHSEVPRWDLDTVVSNKDNYDTTGTTTSDTIVVKRYFTPGYEYILVLGQVDGANVAACSVGVRIDAWGRNDSLLSSVLVDSILSATDQRKLLPIHDHPGIKHSIVLQGVGNNGAEIIFNEIEIYRRIPIQVMKRSQP